jgi:pyruvate/2-oxoglutarate dehydrogenase complex dihydrolipoamide acyltransferase (E2) component
MPQLGLTMEEGSVTGWLKKPGEWVEKGEALFTVETDKVEMEVEAMGKGYLGKIQVELNQKVPVGTLLTTLTDQPETTG